MELAREKKSTAVEKVLQDGTVQALAVKKFDEVANKLPKKIEGTFEVPKIREMILATSEKNVQGFIEFELIKLAERINVSGNLTDSQIEFTASQLIDQYPNETIADFKICFERGASGAYGKVFKLDGIEVGLWVKAYLDEKYQVLEKQLMESKDDPYKPLTVDADVNPDTHQKWLDKLKEVNQAGRKIPDIPEKEIQEEGQERPKTKPHPKTSVGDLIAHNERMRGFQLKAFNERNPYATQEEINKFLAQMKQHEIPIPNQND